MTNCRVAILQCRPLYRRWHGRIKFHSRDLIANFFQLARLIRVSWLCPLGLTLITELWHLAPARSVTKPGVRRISLKASWVRPVSQYRQRASPFPRGRLIFVARRLTLAVSPLIKSSSNYTEIRITRACHCLAKWFSRYSNGNQIEQPTKLSDRPLAVRAPFWRYRLLFQRSRPPDNAANAF